MTPESKARVAELLNVIHNAADEIEELLEGEDTDIASEIHYFLSDNIGRDPDLFITPKQMAEKLLA
jgi:hypothetical protein